MTLDSALARSFRVEQGRGLDARTLGGHHELTQFWRSAQGWCLRAAEAVSFPCKCDDFPNLTTKPIPRAAPLRELALRGFCAPNRQRPGADVEAILIVEVSISSSPHLIGMILGVSGTIHTIKTSNRQEVAIEVQSQQAGLCWLIQVLGNCCYADKG